MKYKFLSLILLSILYSCKPDNQNSYDMAFIHCKEIFEKNGGVGSFTSPNCLEGFKLPYFKSVTNTKDTISIHNLIGKPSVINMWFIGCVPCEAEVPGLNRLANKYGDKVSFLAIGRNKKEYLNEYLENNEWNFKHINDPNSLILTYSFNHTWGYPTTLISDKNGIIVKAFTGGKSDSTAIEHIVNEIEPTLIKLIDE
jgi:thiol-disulfide isomerase/thioredoxin